MTDSAIPKRTVPPIRLIPRSADDIRIIKAHGLRAWLTWCAFEQAVGDRPLLWWQRMFRKIL